MAEEENGRRAGRVASPRSGSLSRDQGAGWDSKSTGTKSDDLVDPVAAFCRGEIRACQGQTWRDFARAEALSSSLSRSLLIRRPLLRDARKSGASQAGRGINL